MKRNKRSVSVLLSALVFAIALCYLIFQFSPSSKFVIPSFIFLGNGKLSVEYLFYLFFFLFTLCLVWFLSKSRFQGILVGFITVSYLLLRALGFRNIFFLLLLLALFVTLELLFKNSKG